MELWIRSQDKKKLIKVNEIKIESVIDGNSFIYSDTTDLGTYKTKERAIEILDEIQNKIKTILYLKPKNLLELNDIKLGKRYFEQLNGVEFITCDNNFEIEPITANAIVYEMPEE